MAAFKLGGRLWWRRLTSDMLPNVTIDEEVRPVWDDQKAAIVGTAGGSFDLWNPELGGPLRDRWWRAIDTAAGEVIGFAWLTCDKNGAEASVAVAANHLGSGTGRELLRRVRDEAEKHHNALQATIRSSNPTIEVVLDWLIREGFVIQPEERSKEIALKLARLGNVDINLQLSF
jgi:GNAT superfamily N-acetyltransferase